MNKKKINLFFLAIFIVITGCNKEVYVDLDIPDADIYAQLYMPQAAYYPMEMGVSITDQDYKVPYSAYLGGPKVAASDITVDFDVAPELIEMYNQKNSTSYEIMPTGSYTLENPSTIIPAGTQSTGILSLTLKTVGFLEPFETYILPVKLSQPEGIAKLNEEMSVTYFLFTGSYAPGNVPREKVLSIGKAAGTFLIDFNGDFILKEPSSGDLLLYKVEESTGQFVNPPKTISTGWNVMDKIGFFGGNRLIARWGSNGGNINQYVLDQNGNFGPQREVGQGWGVLADIIPFKGLLLGIATNGDMTMYPLNSDGEFDYGSIKQISKGWGSFAHIFPYENSLLAIESNGDMWQYPLSNDGVFGARKKVGTGWDMYSKVISANKDLLALDSNGDIWRYKFNPVGLWPLK